MSTWSDLKNNPRLKNTYDARIKILRLIREFFWSRGFVETDTPVAVRYAGQEPYLNPAPIMIHDAHSTTHKMYLRTSPEYALKKLLAAGYGKIFEIGKCFRDFESFGGIHNTEFTMLEWYRAPGSYLDFMNDTEELFKHVGRNLGNVGVLKYKDREAPFDCRWDRMSMKEVWKKHLQANLDDYLEIENLKKLAAKRGYKIDDGDAYEDVFYKIFLNEIEPKLGLEKPVFIYDYPAQMASLSRLCEHDQRYAERAECYIGGLELCNGFGELTNAEEQKARLEKDRNLRKKLGKEIWPVDEDFIDALASLHSTAKDKAGGVALGVDRMVLLFTGAKDLNEAMFGSMADQLSL